MKNISTKSRIIIPVSMFVMTCIVFLLFGQSVKVSAKIKDFYNNHVIFTAPSAVKIYDGTPLTEQIDVTVQGLPEGFTYKAVAEGSVTYPEDNKENNNVVTDYVILDPSGLEVTDKFTNVELRPGTLEVTYGDRDVLGARRDPEDIEDATVSTDDHEVESQTTIEDEKVALSALPDPVQDAGNIEVVIYIFLLTMMFAAFIFFLADSRKKR